MRKRDHVKAWVNHAALNAGEALRACWHVVLPPQVDHSPLTVRSLSKSNPALEFLYGTGILKRPPWKSNDV